jgi:sn-glycerol 3-phosphate transport system ATP-binding protein
VIETGTGARGDVTLGIRPEHLVPAENGLFELQVELLEQLGANTLVHGYLNGTDTQVVASLNGVQTIETGTVLGFDTPGHDLHLFDGKTGKRI